jgi:hypothetical protein
MSSVFAVDRLGVVMAWCGDGLVWSDGVDSDENEVRGGSDEAATNVRRNRDSQSGKLGESACENQQRASRGIVANTLCAHRAAVHTLNRWGRSLMSRI